MTERLSDGRVAKLIEEITLGSALACGERPQIVRLLSELLDLRVVVHELRQNIGIIGAELADKGAKLAAYKLLTEENEKLRARCTWLQERRAVLRKLVAAKWSKRQEVRRMRAHIEELNAATSNAIGEALDLRAKLAEQRDVE